MPKSILVVEDDPINRTLVKNILQGKGYEVILAQDGAEGLELLRAKKPDGILLDIHMPRLDGYGFIRAKFNNPDTVKIPVIVLTAEKKTEPMFRRYGIKAYLLKPINTEDLLEKIQTHVPLEG